MASRFKRDCLHGSLFKQLSVFCLAQLEYFMIQCLKHKAKERPEKRRGNKVNELRPPHLEQPGQRKNLRRFHSCLAVFGYFKRLFTVVKDFARLRPFDE